MTDCLLLIGTMVSNHGRQCPSVTMVKHFHLPWSDIDLMDMVSDNLLSLSDHGQSCSTMVKHGPLSEKPNDK